MFGNQFGYVTKGFVKRSEQLDMGWDDIRFDSLSVKPGKDFKGSNNKERQDSASKILELLKLRDLYKFPEHTDCNKI